ncbi:hypothetical protein LV89_01852 [Arcicella aurantiaca]|uniref:Uncharacterized protein n=1 Tax=Arcicella aurantiaca TaxID=591202 RepID=A0A316E961_9BACT|nr:hypothetical protein [Arcicella aurantiaca]PWK27040.1 hypothetical protein LV89_01852 [Arcicella aurantiaca]
MLILILAIAAIIGLIISVSKSIRFLRQEDTKSSSKWAWIAVSIVLVYALFALLYRKLFPSKLASNQILVGNKVRTLYVDTEAMQKVAEMSRAKQFEFVPLKTFTKDGVTFNEGQTYTGGYFNEHSELAPSLSNDFYVDNDKSTNYFKRILLITNTNSNTPNPEVRITNIPIFRV